MALSRVKNWIANEVLTSSALNAEFNNILNNALSLISPLTGNLDVDGKQLILDGDADTTITADTDDQIDFALGGTDTFVMLANGEFRLQGVRLEDYFQTTIAGLVPSIGTDTDHDIDFTVGACMATDGTNWKMFKSTTAAFTKQIDVDWVAGNAAGGFPSGLTLSNTTVYSLFLIGKDDGTVDFGFDTSAAAANLLTDASDFTWYRRIGAVRTDGSANILAFTATEIANGALDVTLSAVITGNLTVNASRSTVNMSALDRICMVKIYINIVNAGAVQFWAGALTQADAAPAAGSANMVGPAGTSVANEFHVMTNASSQIGMRGDIASTTVDHGTFGWVDFRLS